MSLRVDVFDNETKKASHPAGDLKVPNGYKITGGGALEFYSPPGNMLTAAYPKSLQTWSVAGKDHEQTSPAVIKAFVLALFDPFNEWDVVIAEKTSDSAEFPTATATLPDDYVLTGGGACVNYGSGSGNILTASFPSSKSTWEARGKDHLVRDPASITAYAIGIRHRAGTLRVEGHIQHATGKVASHPFASVTLELVRPAWIVTGGGAVDNWQGQGNLLTGSYPQGDTWHVNGKDHLQSSPADVTAYVLGIRTVA